MADDTASGFSPYKINDLAGELVDVTEIFEVLAEPARRQGLDLRLEHAVVIGLFNYQKMPMVQDLESATSLLAEHDLVAALADVQRSEVPTPDDDYSPPPVDAIKPDKEFLVLDADSSQQQAIQAVLAGRDLVIEGPPGTGKSQTIANLIASASARGWRVLFVAEKRAAIEAVTQRLDDAGLADLVLDLHRTTVDKKHVAEQLAESLARLAQEPPVDASELHRRLAERRTWLAGYTRAFHERRAPWGRSAYDVREELLRLGDEHLTRHAIRGDRLRVLDARTAPTAADDIERFVELGGVRILRRESPWWRAEPRQEDLGPMLAELDQLASTTLRHGTDGMHHLLARVGLPVPPDIAGWQQVLELLDEVTDTVTRFGPYVFGDGLDDLHLATASRAERSRLGRKMPWLQRRALVKQARAMNTDGLTNKPALHRALSDAMRQRAHWRQLAGPGAVPVPDAGLHQVAAVYQQLRRQLASVALSARLDGLERRAPAEVANTLHALRQDKDTLYKLPEITTLRRRFEGVGLGDLLAELAERNVTPRQAKQMFWHSWLRSLDDEFKLASAYLRNFTPEQHDRLVKEFQESDRRYLEATVRRVRRQVAVHARRARDDYPDQAKTLRNEASKVRRLMPLRKLVEQTSDVLLALRPCWAMSPLVVSRTLPATRLFDLVIFDEASQVKPHDAITSIMRGNRLVVAGDEKQLPPSSFFDRQLSGELDEDDEAFDLGDYESILGSMRPMVRNTRLRWHYRSRDERLIAFSNSAIYDGDLVTFPGAQQETPLRLEVVDGTASPGTDGLPAQEVHKVVELVLEHAERRPDESLGVITLGAKHQDRLEQAIRQARRARPDLDEFFAEDAGSTHRFFVKNIETVQGDERDAIILSIGVARRADGVVSRTGFGVLNQEVGKRRLNVAITRAKRRMTVVSSFPSSALAPSDNVNGTELLRRYLELAERDIDPRDVGRSAGTELNGFERDIRARLTEAGITVNPQWGVSGYRIDFALAHPNEPGRMVLAVEADGDSYHRITSTRDRDRLRQNHLETLGWRFHRVWASAWFSDPEAETEKIVNAWRAAVAEHDARPASSPRPPERKTPAPAPTNVRQGPYHHVPPGFPIQKYTDRQLLAVCRWLISDGLALDREERVAQAMKELGFKQRGKRIVERLTWAVQIAQDQADQCES
ncbi:AAA domain-containing protein [Pseudonocardia acaciae]|uniref:AAA domain-containing protein n=1 Tax=Pseudonocardia acaciae TaxID=551276 RepID=UPI0012ED31B6|nr:AAA domain-containing protein [Pseudonocardia acaciae]